jgi:hypothetical protein
LTDLADDHSTVVKESGVLEEDQDSFSSKAERILCEKQKAHANRFLGIVIFQAE